MKSLADKWASYMNCGRPLLRSQTMTNQVFASTLEEQTKILAHYGRTLFNLENDVLSIKKWFRTQPHLPEIPCDAMIGKFLILNKFNLDKTKQKLEMYYTIRPKLAKILQVSSINPTKSEILAYADINYLIPLPNLSTDLNRVIVFKIVSPSSDLFSPVLSFVWMFALSEIRMIEDWHLGTVFICDGVNCSFEHLVKITPSLIRKAQTIFKKVFCASVKAVHFINCPEGFDTFLKIFKSICGTKAVDRVFVHNSSNTICEYISKDLLPSDYGGNEKSMKELNEMLKSKIGEYKSYFDHLDSLVIDENLRPEKLNDDGIFGLYGNFKQLDID